MIKHKPSSANIYTRLSPEDQAQALEMDLDGKLDWKPEIFKRRRDRLYISGLVLSVASFAVTFGIVDGHKPGTSPVPGVILVFVSYAFAWSPMFYANLRRSSPSECAIFLERVQNQYRYEPSVMEDPGILQIRQDLLNIRKAGQQMVRQSLATLYRDRRYLTR